MLRHVLGRGESWRDKLKLLIIRNEDLYARCGIMPANLQSVNARWRLFGHVLRMHENMPARQTAGNDVLL